MVGYSPWGGRESDTTEQLHSLSLRKGFPGGSVVKNLPANAGDAGSTPGSGRSTGGGNGNPLHYSCLGNPMVRETGGLYSPRDRKRVGRDLVSEQQ